MLEIEISQLTYIGKGVDQVIKEGYHSIFLTWCAQLQSFAKPFTFAPTSFPKPTQKRTLREAQSPKPACKKPFHFHESQANNQYSKAPEWRNRGYWRFPGMACQNPKLQHLRHPQRLPKPPRTLLVGHLPMRLPLISNFRPLTKHHHLNKPSGLRAEGGNGGPQRMSLLLSMESQANEA